MSKHFTNKAEVQHKTSLSHLLDPRRPKSPGELRFIYHGYFRVGIAATLLTYFLYCNPEYSYTYTAVRERYGWDKQEPSFPQYFKIQVGGKGDGFLPLPTADRRPGEGEGEG